MLSRQGRLGAFEAALQANGLGRDPSLTKTGAPSFVMGHDTMSHLLSLVEPPNALICGGFEISNSALDCCLRTGQRFPDDIAFVGYGDPISYSWIGEGISMIDISPASLAGQTSHMLSAKRDAAMGSTIWLTTKLVLRDSTGSWFRHICLVCVIGLEDATVPVLTLFGVHPVDKNVPVPLPAR